MTFHPVEVDENFGVYKLASENGRWELGLARMAFGVRVRASTQGSGWCPVDYCAGADMQFQLELLGVIKIILSSYPETVTQQEIEQLFDDYPYQRKPINLDPCWPKLVNLAMSIVDKQEEKQA